MYCGDFVAIDIETTGLNPESDEIIEIGAVKFRQSKKVDEFQSLINIGRKIPEFIKALTHISDDDIRKSPSAKKVYQGLLHFIGSDILCFHNYEFDMNFLKQSFLRNEMLFSFNPILDTLEISRIFTPYLHSHNLIQLCNYFSIDITQAHRAVHDAEATGILLNKLTKFIIQNFDIDLIAQVTNISAQMKQDTYLHFYLDEIRKHLTKISLTRSKTKKRESVIKFRGTNFVSNIDTSRPSATQQEFDREKILGMFEQGGQIANNFPDYEFRQGQIDMTDWTIKAYQEKKILLVEAGTGVGKSLAYLIPSIFFAKYANKHIIISTNTKNLQEQLFYKDIPTIQKVTDLKFSAVLLKGRGNYICLRRWNEIQTGLDSVLTPYEMKQLLNLLVWAYYTKTGDIEENHSFQLKQGMRLWSKIRADGRFCSGRKCKFYKDCYVMNIRAKAERANLVIINHALLLSDMVSEHSVLGEYSHLIIDEAHNLPFIASEYLGISLSASEFLTTCQRIFTTGKYQYGVIPNLKIALSKSLVNSNKREYLKKDLNNLVPKIETLESTVIELFKKLNKIVCTKGKYGKLRYKNKAYLKQLAEYFNEIDDILGLLIGKFSLIYNELTGISSDIMQNYDQNLSDVDGVKKDLEELRMQLHSILEPDFENTVYWIETSDIEYNEDKFPHSTLHSAPIEIKESLNKYLFNHLDTAVLTSATMAIRSKFKFFKTLLGLDLLSKGATHGGEENKILEFVAESPFNYEKQASILLPNFIVSPKDPNFPAQATRLLDKILEQHSKGTLVLFTSYKNLNDCYNILSEKFLQRDVILLAQGKSGSRTSMLEIFRENKSSVLFGTRSFWEGIDVKGEALEMLILYKLPFMVPSEPTVEAYNEKLEKHGKNPFMYYSLPMAILHFKQGFGRLIRNKTDKGIVIVLDSRIVKKQYGRYFIEDMPRKPTIVSSEIEMIDLTNNWFREF